MDESALMGLGPQADTQAQHRALQYFEELKSSTDGWKLCASALTSGVYSNQDHVKFFCLQVIEHYLKSSYASSNAEDHENMKSFLNKLIEMQIQNGMQEKTFIRNKVAQVLSLVFVVDYPSRWESFLTDFLPLLNLGDSIVDLYLRTLLGIDSEVVDREIVHTQEEVDRNTAIKDHMRVQCVPQLVESWYLIVTMYEHSNAELACQCLQVIGAYISWIDISLIANDKFVPVLMRFMGNGLLRESTCDCIHEVILKGMEPMAKVDLIESFMSVLTSSGYLQLPENDDDEESDYLAKLSKLINGIGLQLILCWQRLLRSKNEEKAKLVLGIMEAKIPLMLRFLRCEDDDVSGAVAEFAHDYLTVLKQVSPLEPSQKENVKNLMLVVMEKMKFDDSYNHETEGEDEAMFLAYRKELRDIFNNLGALDAELVLSTIHKFFTASVSNWQGTKYQDVELALTLLYSVAESLPSAKGQHFTGDPAKVTRLQEMMQLLVSSRVSFYRHPAVVLQYFETINRYDKFFNIEPQYVADVLMSFLDDRGLRNPSPHIRSRVAYIFSRFVRTVNKQHLAEYLPEILKHCDNLLVLHTPDNGLQQTQGLSEDDQLFMYETAGVLIASSQEPAERKQAMMRHLLAPLVSKYETLLQALLQEQDPERQQLYASCIAQALSYASRTSKAFSMQQTVQQCGCIEVYTEVLKVFLRGLDVPVHRPQLHAGIRQFLHRMVVCLDADVLPFIPIAMEQLLKNADARELHDFIPLINQVVMKFKKVICPFLVKVFMPIVNTIFAVLSSPLDERDQVGANERCLLQRSYYSFLVNLINNNVADVLASQAPDHLHTVLLTVIHGAVEYHDPQSQRVCFNILTKLVSLWGGSDSVLAGFADFVYKQIVPACFMAPMKPSFDLSDAQTVLALNESGCCMRAILEKGGEDFVQYLQNSYLPTLNLAPEVIQEYCQALKSDAKVFKAFLKAFFVRAKS